MLLMERVVEPPKPLLIVKVESPCEVRLPPAIARVLPLPSEALSQPPLSQPVPRR
jgi:hypothetical protein